jgi:hypothetical protein
VLSPRSTVSNSVTVLFPCAPPRRSLKPWLVLTRFSKSARRSLQCLRRGAGGKGLLRDFSRRPLDAGVGMQRWIAFRRYEPTARLTVYLGTEAGCVYPPGSAYLRLGSAAAASRSRRMVA